MQSAPPAHCFSCLASRQALKEVVFLLDRSALQVGSLREVHVVDSIDNWRSRQRATVKIPAVKALEGIVASGNFGKFDIDFAIRAVTVDANVNDLAIFDAAFFLEVFFEILGPIGIGLSMKEN